MIKSLQSEYEDRGIEYGKAMPIIEVYKEFRRRVRNSLSTHHIISRQFGGPDIDKNRKVMIHRAHEGLHDYHGNNVTHQKIRQILTDDQTVLRPGFLTAIDELINKHDSNGWIYEKGIWRP